MEACSDQGSTLYPIELWPRVRLNTSPWRARRMRWQKSRSRARSVTKPWESSHRDAAHSREWFPAEFPRLAAALSHAYGFSLSEIGGNTSSWRVSTRVRSGSTKKSGVFGSVIPLLRSAVSNDGDVQNRCPKRVKRSQRAPRTTKGRDETRSKTKIKKAVPKGARWVA
ncbi:hypothetical protein VTI28DRAFT_9706 [Corynascus sepedonium]